MKEPETPEGFMVLHNAGRHDIGCSWSRGGVHNTVRDPCTCHLADDIATIEAEAAQKARDEAVAPLPTRKDVAEAMCFLARHRHDNAASCPKNRHEADRLVRALSARYDNRAAIEAIQRGTET